MLHGDNRKFLPVMPKEKFDLLIADPPYNMGGNDSIQIPGRSDIKRSFGEWDSFEDDDCFLQSTYSWMEQVRPLLSPNASCYVFCTAENSGDIRRINESLGLKHKATITWHKTNPPPHFRKTNFLSSCESLVFSVVDNRDFAFNWIDQKSMHNFIEGPACMGRERLKSLGGQTLHPTQKPEWVLRHFISISHRRGGWVLDPFMGTGTTLCVAREFGMNGVGIEMDDTYFSAALERLQHPSFDYDDEVVTEMPWTSMT
jgi:DNA modification methylase